jgi:SAM-dependent methyltransferase
MSPVGRPLWKRVGGRVRRGVQRSLNVFDRASDPSGAPVPPADLRAYYYRTRDLPAFIRARDAVRVEVLTHGLTPADRVLDIGSGIGNLALALIDAHQGTYDGVEINPEAAAWCRRAITPRNPRFRFHHADVAGGAYNPSGRLTASQYRFPFPDASFDFVFLGSVFTHMLPPAVAHYLAEIGRLLAPGGTCAASFFLLDDDRRGEVEAGRGFMAFPASIESARLHDRARPEAAVAIEETFVLDAYSRAGLRIERIRRGDWWNGRADDQDVITALTVRRTPPGI